MRRRSSQNRIALGVLLLSLATVLAGAPADATGGSDEAASGATVACASKIGDRQTCEADTQSGIKLRPPPRSFLFNTDEVAPKDQAGYLKVYDMYGRSSRN